MGFMGFGMQRWIYTQRPRQFFSKERKSIGNSLPSYTNRIDTTQRVISSKKWIYKPTHWTIKVLIVSTFLILMGLITLSLFGMVYKGNALISLTNDITSNVIHQQKLEKDEAYSLLTNSGRQLYQKGDYHEAFNELMRAHKLYPNAIYHHVQFANMYTDLCNSQNLYCLEAAEMKKQLTQVHEGNEYLNKLK